jgi:hypothetical protein
MKLLLLALFSTSAFAGYIIPNIRRNSIEQNESSLGAAWTKRQDHFGVGIIESDKASTIPLELSYFSYGEMFKMEIKAISKSSTLSINSNFAWMFESSVIGFTYEDEGNTADDQNYDLAYGMKHSGNIYSGFGYHREGTSYAIENNVYYLGLGYLNNFDENKKTALEGSLEIVAGDDDGSAELPSSFKFGAMWTEINNDYQITVNASYFWAEYDVKSLESDYLLFVGAIEKRITNAFFVELAIAYGDYNLQSTVSSSTTNSEVSSLGLSMRYVASKKHQFIFDYIRSNVDTYFVGLYGDGTVSSLNYSYLF